ncbi:Paired domain-containing protein [Aphelenchoides fujianensis]|nr:Paired domain-containing protein [Aphelenchoides fujianensis]
MDCAFVSAQCRVFVHTQRAEDLVARFPSAEQPAGSLTAATGAADSLAAILMAANGGYEAAKSAGTPSSASLQLPSAAAALCGCLIDTSTPASLQRDFYAWLQGDFCSTASSASSASSAAASRMCCAADEDAAASFLFFSAMPTTSEQPAAADSAEGDPKARQRRRRNGGGTRGPSGRGTNLYGRPYCPGRPLSMDERYQIIQLFHAGMKVNAISKQLFRETGLLIPSSHAECRRRKRLQIEAENRIKTELQHSF